MYKKAQTSFIRNVIIGLILIAVLLFIIAVASGQAGKWGDYIAGLLRI